MEMIQRNKKASWFVGVELGDFSEKTLIAMANDLSGKIDEIALDQGNLDPEVHMDLKSSFEFICRHLANVYDTELLSTVTYPKFL